MIAASPAAAEACPLTNPSLTLSSLTAYGVPCAEAHELALHVARSGSGPGDWSCTGTFSGRYASYACVDRLVVSRQVYFTYYAF